LVFVGILVVIIGVWIIRQVTVSNMTTNIVGYVEE
jgi:hypothetical protein